MSRPSIIENSKYSYAISNEYHKTSGTVSPKREVPSSNQYLRQKITLKRGSRKVQAAEAKAKKFSHKLRWECTTKVWSCSVCLLEDSRKLHSWAASTSLQMSWHQHQRICVAFKNLFPWSSSSKMAFCDRILKSQPIESWGLIQTFHSRTVKLHQSKKREQQM